MGQIVGAFGLRGQLKIEAFTDFLSRFEKGARLRLKGEWVEVQAMKVHKGRPLIKLIGVDNATSAQALQWEFLEAEGAPDLAEDEFLSKELIGLDVRDDQTGELLGNVEQVLPYPAHDILVVGGMMIPMVKEFVRRIDLKGKKIVVHLIPGMRPSETDI